MTDASAPETPKLPPCSIPPTCQISFRNIPEDAQWKDKFIAVIRTLAETTGRCMNLSNLDGITIGFDYDDALASVDLGYESSIAKHYTKQENLLGVGKALRVRRNGEIKMHIVLNGNVLLDLVNNEPTTEEFWGAANIFAHELGHVQTAGWFEAHSPGIMLTQHEGDWATNTLRETAHTLWEEYAACRLSALISQGSLTTTSYTQGLETSVRGALGRARSAIKNYRTHSDVARLLVETAREIAMPLKMSAYLLGHLDGLGENTDIDSRCHFAGEMTPHFHELLSALRGIWETRESWDGLASLDPIVDVIVSSLQTAGIVITLNQEPPGSRVDVPYRAETLPNGEADMAIIQMRQTLGLEP